MSGSRLHTLAICLGALAAAVISPPAFAKNDIDSLDGPKDIEEGETDSWTCTWDKDEEVTFSWDFGDGTTLTETVADGESTVSHTYLDGDASYDVVCAAETTDGKHRDEAKKGVDVENVEPELAVDGPGTCTEGTACTWTVELVDPGTLDTHTWTVTLPDGAAFDSASGEVTWTPSWSQLGDRDLTLEVEDDDGGRGDAEWTVTVDQLDEDGDGLSDTWETEVGLDPTDASDAGGDPDGDGRTSAEEFALGTDPLHDDGPATPVLVSPTDGGEWIDQAVIFEVETALNSVGDEVQVHLAAYADEAMTTLIAESGPQDRANDGRTSWRVTEGLVENTWISWWAMAEDDWTTGDWSDPATFFYNAVPEAPGAPGLHAPADGGWVSTDTPEFLLDAALDPDLDPLTYTIVLRSADGGELARVSDLPGDEAGATWTPGVTFAHGDEACWEATARDDTGLTGPTAGPACFVVDLENEAPSAPSIAWPEQDDRVWRLQPEILVDNGVDPEGRYTEHLFELDTDPAFGSPDLQTAAVPSGDDGTTLWVPELALADDTVHHLRVVCSDGAATSEAVSVSFRVNSENDPPETPVLQNPEDGAVVADGEPFGVVNAFDSDDEPLVYDFRFTSMDSGEIVREARVQEDTGDTTSWVPEDFDDGLYIWTVRAVDPKDLASDWATPRGFEVGAAEVASSEAATPLSFTGCSATGQRTGGLGGLLVLVFGLLTRLHRRTPAGNDRRVGSGTERTHRGER